MIELTKKTITILAPIERVFEHVINMENYKFWFPDVIAIQANDTRPHASVGKTYIETLAIAGCDQTLTIKVVECVKNTTFVTQGDLVGILPQMTVCFWENELGCQLELSYHSREPALNEQSPIITRLRENLAPRAEVGLTQLKHLLENP
ncbi:SRPBCC family protein [Pseudoalteromonas luteoviolacea]|uniref:Polyketide cyclase n=1 Tax=Pseudoalteromonas luteoviolacea H33 TaxID=1365251 RepID=A0A162AG03_9GAMM|nr:SRPBCC family protein [Pseudoalteromonas luteoviolacea]KZN49085.1 hypothetical protein N476_20460 [Pseudoalteromonas luteoviolacea H33]KZN75492.1 hypothetical protein N477_18770 [Pseudoalteromonas luteoviolacea H33-S]